MCSAKLSVVNTTYHVKAASEWQNHRQLSPNSVEAFCSLFWFHHCIFTFLGTLINAASKEEGSKTAKVFTVCGSSCVFLDFTFVPLLTEQCRDTENGPWLDPNRTYWDFVVLDTPSRPTKLTTLKWRYSSDSNIQQNKDQVILVGGGQTELKEEWIFNL